MARMRRVCGVLIISALALAGCTPTEPPEVPERSTTTPTPVPTPTETTEPGPVEPTGQVQTIASGLRVPWSIVRLENGSSLISERDTALVLELAASGALREVATVPGVQPGGEGGLLGLEVDPEQRYLYAYFTAAADNRVLRFSLTGDAGTLGLGDSQEIITGIPKSGNHNGGRIKFGPDGMLYVTAGDAGNADAAQDVGSLAGKILRLTPTGGIPDDNPFVGSPVYSFGHRNPQGLAWDGEARLWASEFGQNTWDELNIIAPGQNYGWPVVEGIANRDGYVNPVAQWATSEASPSGLLWTRDTLFLAALRGERLWAIYPQPESIETVDWFVGEFGRLRDVVEGPDGTLWMLTNNTARGTPQADDDKLLQVQLTPRPAG
jgi:glucose/arabinose dehydrogenase